MSNNPNVWRPGVPLGRIEMLEWRPRLIVLLVALAMVAAVFADIITPANIGWGCF
jgi:hypothetical protein